MKIKVGIIGAGAAGLCAARHVSDHLQELEPIVFEQSDRVGGTWVYTEDRGIDEYGLPIHSSMYKHMKTALPKEVMSFPDFPFPEEGPSYMGHDQVLLYLQNYAERFDLLRYIKFRYTVTKAVPLEECKGWELTARNVITQEEQLYTVSYLIVCNGRFSEPYIPDIPGLNNFKGKVVHSHDYRKASEFPAETVVCLGRGPSGMDIGLEFSETAKHVYLSHNKPQILGTPPSNYTEVPGIVEASEAGLKLKDGRVIDADVLLLSTGYLVTFPFLPEGFVGLDRKRVEPLYKHLIHCENPTICFVGVPFYITPFPLFDVQYILGNMTLPSREEMLEDEQRDLEERLLSGLLSRNVHFMGHRQWPYFDELGRLADLKPLPAVVKKLFNDVNDVRFSEFVKYKTYNYRIVNEDSFVRL